MKILIGEDLVPTDTNKSYFEEGNASEIVDKKIFDILNEADFRIFNLEVPLTDALCPIDKCGPNLVASTKSINGIKAFNPSLLTLANNHIMDQGESGLKSTTKTLNDNEINFLGAGDNLSCAKKPYIIEKDGLKIGIYACSENEFSIADKDKAGANPFDPLESPDDIAALKSECDYVIVLYHGGKEHYRYPSPNLRKTCRKLCDKGADLVICQHTHCIGCEEKYNSSAIVYGQGNFFFNKYESEFWKTSLLIEADVKGGDTVINYIPLMKDGKGIKKAVADEAKEILDNFNKRSEEIKNDEFVEAAYKAFAETMIKNYYNIIYKPNIFVRVLKKFFKIDLTKKPSLKQNLKLINIIECEAHRELILKGLKGIKKEI